MRRQAAIDPVRLVVRLVLAGLLIYYAASYVYVVSMYQNPWLGVTEALLMLTGMLLLASLFLDLPTWLLEFMGLFTAAVWVTYIATAFAAAKPPVTYTDEEDLVQLAALALLHGVNPYTVKYDLNVPFGTPLLSGGEVNLYPYPALSFILAAPFAAAGLTVPIAVVIFVGNSFLIAYLAARGVGRDLVLASYLVVPTLYQYAFFGVIDGLFYPFIVLAIILIDNPILTGLLMGLAASTSQLTWPIAFMILIHYLTTPMNRGRRLTNALRYLGVVVGVFLAVNGYFIVQNPVAYLHDVFFSAGQSLVPLGFGFISAFLFGAVNVVYIETVLLTLLLVMVLVAVQTYAELRDPVRARYLPFVLGPLVFFTFWRSLANYFMMAVPFTGTALALLLTRDMKKRGG